MTWLEIIVLIGCCVSLLLFYGTLMLIDAHNSFENYKRRMKFEDDKKKRGG